MEGGYASPDIFKTPAPETTAPAIEQPVTAVDPAKAIEPPVETSNPTDPVEVKPAETVIVPTEEKKPVEIVQPPVQPVKPVNPLETLKLDEIAAFYKDKKDDVLKALGLDEFSIEAIKYYQATGGLAEYAAVKSVDYSKMSDEKVLRQQLREELAHMDLEDEDLELMYETRIKNRFKLDEEAYSEREVKASKLEMKLEANKVRTALIERQKKFAPPERQPEPAKEPEMSVEQESEIRLKTALFDNAVSQFISGKKLVLGSGEQTFNYEIENPQQLLDILFMPDKYGITAARKDATGQPLKDSNGSLIPDYNRLLKAAAVLYNDTDYDNKLISYGKSLGTKKMIDDMENPTNNKPPVTSNEPANVWQAMKQNGVKWPDRSY